MDNRQGMTVEPQISYTEDGQEYVSDFNAYNTWGGGEFTPPTEDEYSRFAEYSPELDPDFYDDPDSDAEYMEALDGQYIDALFEAYPSLEAAMDWASSGGVSDELIDDYNAAIDSGDYDLINEAIDRLMNFYYQTTGVEEPEEYELDVAGDDPVDDPNYYFGQEQEEETAQIADILTEAGITADQLEEALQRMRGY